MKTDFDLVILGSGFGGSLLAMIARQLGLSVLMLEKARHPRFVIGESTTPLANLIWADLTAYYDLHELVPFAKWGSWQEQRPGIPVGLKRGFTFLHHLSGRPFLHQQDRQNQLLVAASRFDAEADTHWYRPAFDAHLVECARARNVEFVDCAVVKDVTFAGDTVRLGFEHSTRERHVRARFLLDATGPRGALWGLLGLPEQPGARMPATQSLYTHFRNVHRWDTLFPEDETPPYPVDDAAMHHVFAEGWIWILRFNNGITSAGVACREDLARDLHLQDGTSAWHRLLERLPSVRDQFAEATMEFPFVHAPRLSFRAESAAGARWALLPSAAGFLDPLLSTGFPLNLLGIERLARLLEQDWGRARFEDHLRDYDARTGRELDRAEELIAAMYATMPDFPLFVRLGLLYFAAAAFTEKARRRRQPQAAGDLFLLGEHPTFGVGLQEVCRRAVELYAPGPPAPSERQDLREKINAVLAPVDSGGLGMDERRNWHPLVSE
jgi:tetracycline 7-halogenase / FADH2 O2-dependent halogenase